MHWLLRPLKGEVRYWTHCERKTAQTKAAGGWWVCTRCLGFNQ